MRFVIAIILLLVACVACSGSPTDPGTVEPRTAASTPDLEQQAIISFTQKALEVEAKRNELVAYFAGLRPQVGIHGQTFAVETYFSDGVPATLRDAPPSGFEGMASLRNRLALFDVPRSMQPIRDTLLHIYDSEIEQVLAQSAKQISWGDPIRKLVYPEITPDGLADWRRLAEQSEVGPTRNLHAYKVGTTWFSLQELRRQTSERWAEILQEQGIDPAEEGLTMQAASEMDYRKALGSTGEEIYGAETTYVNVLGLSHVGGSSSDRYQISLAQSLHDVFRMQQRFALASEFCLEPEASWEAYLQRDVAQPRGAHEEAGRILSSLLGMTSEQREHAGLTFEPGAPRDSTEFQNLVKYALRPIYGPSGAKRFVSRLPEEEQMWLEEVSRGSEESFLDYLSSKYKWGSILPPP